MAIFGIMNDILNKDVSILELSNRASNLLKYHKIYTLKDLVTHTEESLMLKRCFGVKSLEEIKTALIKYELTLGMFETNVKNPLIHKWLRKKGLTENKEVITCIDEFIQDLLHCVK